MDETIDKIKTVEEDNQKKYQRIKSKDQIW